MLSGRTFKSACCKYGDNMDLKGKAGDEINIKRKIHAPVQERFIVKRFPVGGDSSFIQHH